MPVQDIGGSRSQKNVYFGSVSVGSPQRQELTVIFDTGSGHVVLPSAACQSEACAVHKSYDSKASENAVEVDASGAKIVAGKKREKVKIDYGSGDIKGVFVEDKLCLGPSASADNACVDLRLVTATEMSYEPFHGFAADGIVGLGMGALALKPEMNFFGMMVKQKQLAHPSFGVFLADSDDMTSEISFGGHNPELVRSPLEWVPVARPEEGHWQVRITRVRVDGETLDFCEDGQCRAVVDTGTSVLAVPTAVAGSLQEKLHAEAPVHDSILDCRLAQGATLHFELETGTTISLGPGEYAREAAEAVDDGSGGSSTVELAPKARECRPTLLPFDMEAPMGPKLFVLGEPVLRKYYTAYDWQEKRVGFALAAKSPQHLNQGAAAAEESAAPRRSKPLLARARALSG
jgi:hypothetical protein